MFEGELKLLRKNGAPAGYVMIRVIFSTLRVFPRDPPVEQDLPDLEKAPEKLAPVKSAIVPASKKKSLAGKIRGMMGATGMLMRLSAQKLTRDSADETVAASGDHPLSEEEEEENISEKDALYDDDLEIYSDDSEETIARKERKIERARLKAIAEVIFCIAGSMKNM